jgi:putative acetyltransferase|tara:strand:- start:80 stop:574 length:495 start_codon:yes stop_codon:yes gene_type:complete
MEENSKWIIRKINKSDNASLFEILTTVMIEFKVPQEGTALSDPELKKMFEAYQTKRSVYFIIEKNNKIFGGAGISQLKNSKENICELQKMYFLNEARGIGMGEKMIKMCIAEAINFGFKKCYIETMHNMKSAQKLYLSQGFNYLDYPLGNTGHSSCPVWMLKEL